MSTRESAYGVEDDIMTEPVMGGGGMDRGGDVGGGGVSGGGEVGGGAACRGGEVGVPGC